ncbi:MAG: RsmE family RNA methyltransferase [Myxococcota bacterium]
MAHVLIEGQPGVGETIRLDEAMSHHLLRVRRLPRGASIVVVDGQGHEAPAQLVGVHEGRAALAVTGPWVGRPATAPRHLVWAIPKGPALDHGLRMAVEAGVTDIHLALGTRSVARSDRHDRWLRIVAGACAQAGRREHPRLGALQSDLAGAVAGIPADTTRFVAVPGGAEVPATGAARAIAVGPEGGFAPHELDTLLDEGWQPVGLGAHVLRSDTAAAVGVAWLTRG